MGTPKAKATCDEQRQCSMLLSVYCLSCCVPADIRPVNAVSLVTLLLYHTSSAFAHQPRTYAVQRRQDAQDWTTVSTQLEVSRGNERANVYKCARRPLTTRLLMRTIAKLTPPRLASDAASARFYKMYTFVSSFGVPQLSSSASCCRPS